MGSGTDIQVGEQAALTLPRFLSSIPSHAKTLPLTLRPSAESALAVADAQLAPSSPFELVDELGACLALVAPVGMTQEERAEWLRSAGNALQGIPLDLLKRGVRAAKQWADHPAKVVPAILREVEEPWKRRRLNRSEVLAAIDKMVEPEATPEERCTPEEAAEIIAAAGLKIEAEAPQRAFSEPPRAPTRAEYLAWGVDPSDIPTEAAV